MTRCVYHIFVSGIVQGVCFRHNVSNFVRQRLKDCRGHVRNLTDGRVEIIISATTEELHSLKDFCYRGISSARIDDFKITKAQEDESNLGPSFIIA